MSQKHHHTNALCCCRTQHKGKVTCVEETNHFYINFAHLKSWCVYLQRNQVARVLAHKLALSQTPATGANSLEPLHSHCVRLSRKLCLAPFGTPWWRLPPNPSSRASEPAAARARSTSAASPQLRPAVTGHHQPPQPPSVLPNDSHNTTDQAMLKV